MASSMVALSAAAGGASAWVPLGSLVWVSVSLIMHVPFGWASVPATDQPAQRAPGTGPVVVLEDVWDGVLGRGPGTGGGKGYSPAAECQRLWAAKPPGCHGSGAPRRCPFETVMEPFNLFVFVAALVVLALQGWLRSEERR